MHNIADGYWLSIPLGDGPPPAAQFGVVEIEPFGSTAENAKPQMGQMVQAAPFEVKDGNAVSRVDLPLGQYLTRLRFPNGRIIIKLIDIVSGVTGPEAQVELSRGNPKGAVDRVQRAVGSDRRATPIHPVGTMPAPLVAGLLLDAEKAGQVLAAIADLGYTEREISLIMPESAGAAIGAAFGALVGLHNAGDDSATAGTKTSVSAPDLLRIAGSDLLIAGRLADELAARAARPLPSQTGLNSSRASRPVGHPAGVASAGVSNRARQVSSHKAGDHAGPSPQVGEEAGARSAGAERGARAAPPVSRGGSSDSGQAGRPVAAAQPAQPLLGATGAALGAAFDRTNDVPQALRQLRAFEEGVKRGGVAVGVAPRRSADAAALREIFSRGDGTGISGPAATDGDAVMLNNFAAPFPLRSVHGLRVTLPPQEPYAALQGLAKPPPDVRSYASATSNARVVCDLTILHGNARLPSAAMAASEAQADPLDLGEVLGLWVAREASATLLARREDAGVDLLDPSSDPGPALDQRYALGRMTAAAPDHARNDGAQRLILARLPGPWHCAAVPHRAAIQVSPVAVGAHGSLNVSVSDTRIEAILDFMQQTDLTSALSLVETCVEVLFFKHENPYAAAAAAYVLLAAPPDRTPPEFNQWVARLGHLCWDIPDGCIQHAAILLQTATDSFPENEKDFPVCPQARIALAADLLIESTRRGLPLYRSGYKVLISTLRIVQEASGLPPPTQARIAQVARLVNHVRLRLDITQPFTVVNVTGLLRYAPWAN